MVEWKKLGEVCKTVSPPKKLEKELYGNVGLYPIIDQGQKEIVGFTDDLTALLPYGEYVLFGDHTRFVKYYRGKFAQGADGLKILKANESIIPRYFFYVFDNTEVPSRGYSRHWSIAKQLLIPIPSLSEQQRIVSILDTFTSSISNLKQQIEERRKQYEYERDLLLDLEGKEGVEMKKLGEVLQIKKGDYITKKEAKEGVYPVILGGKEPAYYIDRYNHVGKAIVISRSGASAGYVSFWNQPIFITDGFLIEPKENVLFEFLYYTLKSKQRELHGSQKGGAIPHVTPASISTIKSLFPPLSTQSRIVSILDTFEQSISNLEEQLAMREKQYEYYRNQLLTFEGEEERGKT